MPLPFVTARGNRGGAFAAAPAAPAVSVAATVTREDALVGWWKMDEASGSTASDSTTAGNDAELVADGAFAAGGKNNNCVDLDGTGDYITIPASSVHGTPPLTWSLWVNLDGTTNQATILGDSAYPSHAGEFTMQYRTGGGTYDRVLFVLYTSGSDYTAVWYDLASDPESSWNHYAYTLANDGGSAKVRFLYNGVEQVIDSTAHSGGAGTADGNAFTFGGAVKTNPLLWLGRYSTAYINGKIDDVRVYNEILTDDEIGDIAEGDWS